MRKGQPRPHRVDNEVESQLHLRGEGAREDSWGARTSTLPAAVLPLLRLGNQNYNSQEAARPASPTLPAPRPLRPAPPRDRLVYKGRMARPGAERGGGAGSRLPSGACWTQLPQPEAAAPRSPPRAAPGLPCGRPPHTAGAPQTRKPEVESGFALGALLGLADGFRRESGPRGQCAAEEGEERRAGRVLGPCEEAGRARRGPRGARRPTGVARPIPSPGTRPLGAPASQLPAISAGPERRGRCQLFGLGRRVWTGARGSGPPNVDYLVRIGRARRIHPRTDSFPATVASLAAR